MRIDAHQHFWRLARGDYGWLTPDDHPAIYRDFTPDDLAPLLAAVGVERTILVQAAPSLAETEFLLEVATATPFVAGVVGWTDLEAPNARATIEALSRNPKLLGLRPMLQDLNDDAWILRASITPALDAMKDASLTFDALVKPRHLGNLGKLIDARPDLRIAIDHGAKPDISGAFGTEAWASQMRAIGRNSAAFCPDDLRPYVDVLLEAFGPSRLMWGSDWPVVNEAGGYAAWHSAAHALTETCSTEERDLIFGRTAQHFYCLQ